MRDTTDEPADWTGRSARAAMASHRLVGWVFWDPDAIARYEALGVPKGTGYYVASRAAPLAPAGPGVVAAAFGSIHAGFVRACLERCAEHTTWDAVYAARNEAVGEGLRRHVPDIVAGLAAMGGDLWDAAESLPASARPLYAAHRDATRPDDPLVSSWLALNCIREWRGDTHWAILAAEDVDGVQAGILHNEHLGYPRDWIPRSRGADDAALEAAYADLEARGLAAAGVVTDSGRALRRTIEERTDRLSERAWRHLGAERTDAFLALVEPVGDRLLARIDETAGTEWMPAARAPRAS